MVIYEQHWAAETVVLVNKCPLKSPTGVIHASLNTFTKTIEDSNHPFYSESLQLSSCWQKNCSFLIGTFLFQPPGVCMTSPAKATFTVLTLLFGVQKRPSDVLVWLDSMTPPPSWQNGGFVVRWMDFSGLSVGLVVQFQNIYESQCLEWEVLLVWRNILLLQNQNPLFSEGTATVASKGLVQRSTVAAESVFSGSGAAFYSVLHVVLSVLRLFYQW